MRSGGTKGVVFDVILHNCIFIFKINEHGGTNKEGMRRHPPRGEALHLLAPPPPPPSEGKMTKLSHFGQCFWILYTLRYPFCPLEAPTKK